MIAEGSKMLWAHLLAYVTGTVDQELLLRNEYLAAENRMLRGQIKGRLLLSEEEKATLAEIATVSADLVDSASGSSLRRTRPSRHQAIKAKAHRENRWAIAPIAWLCPRRGTDRRYTISKRLPLVLAAALAA